MRSVLRVSLVTGVALSAMLGAASAQAGGCGPGGCGVTYHSYGGPQYSSGGCASGNCSIPYSQPAVPAQAARAPSAYRTYAYRPATTYYRGPQRVYSYGGAYGRVTRPAPQRAVVTTRPAAPARAAAQPTAIVQK